MPASALLMFLKSQVVPPCNTSLSRPFEVILTQVIFGVGLPNASQISCRSRPSGKDFSLLTLVNLGGAKRYDKKDLLSQILHAAVLMYMIFIDSELNQNGKCCTFYSAYWQMLTYCMTWKYSGSYHEWTPLGSKKGVHNWRECKNTEFLWVLKNGVLWIQGSRK